MSWFYRRLLRPLLFTQESEGIHDRTIDGLEWVGRHRALRAITRTFYGSPDLPTEVFGLHFPNPVGLAAGMDKPGEALPVWESMGFGFCELGGVTRHAQPGNPQPRMFRAIHDRALINRMGFNNPGAEAMAATLRNWRSAGLWPKHPVGINLGKSKVTPLAEAAGDYAFSFRQLQDLADFFVVNVSSPNTPNLRQLQDKSALDEILAGLQEVQSGKAPDQRRPILIKVAPDLTFEALDDILELVGPREVAGIVATNTTLTRPDASHSHRQRIYGEAGGLSGAPLRQRSTEVIRHLYRQSRGNVPLIGVGGILSEEDAWEKITAGASLVQLYSGLVYEGPGLPRRVVRGFQARLRQHGFTDLRQAVGTAVR